MITQRKIKAIAKIIFAACLIILAGSIFLDKLVERKIEKELSEISPLIKVKFSAIHVNLISSSVSLDSLQINYNPYTNMPQSAHVFYFPQVSLTGIRISSFIFKKELLAANLLLNKGNIQLDRFLLDKKDSAQDSLLRKTQWPFEKLSIGNIELKSTTILSRVNHINKPLAKGDLTIGRVHINPSNSTFGFQNIDCSLVAIKYSLANTNDSILIQKLVVDSKAKTVEVDSLRLISVNKAFVSSTRISGLDFQKLINDRALKIDEIKSNNSLMNISPKKDLLKKLPFDLQKIDVNTLELNNAFISYKDASNECCFKASVVLNDINTNLHDKNALHIGSARCSLSNIDYRGSHNVQIRSVALDSRKQTIEINGLSVHSSNKTFVPRINATGFNIPDLFQNHRLSISSLNVNGGSLTFSGTGKSEALPTLPFDLRTVSVNEFRIRNAYISYKGKNNECHFKTSIALEGLGLTSTNPNWIQYSTARCSFSDLRYSGSNYQNIYISSIDLDSKKEIIQVDNLRIVPQLDRYEFDRKLGHQADRIDATIPRIQIIKPQMQELLHQKLFAERINISTSKVYIFRDRRLPRLQNDVPLPMRFLKTVPIELRVKNCELASSTVEYEEYPKSGYGQTGVFRLEHATATISPLINHPLPSDPAYLVMNVSGSVMGTGTANATTMMPLRDNQRYRIKGRFDNLDLTKLNSSSENLGKIRIKSGFLDFLTFEFAMTDQQSTGKIVGAYHNLIIQQLKKHTKEKNVADVSSFVLRHAIIPLNKDQSLPEKKRTGAVTYKRDPTRFVTYYYLHTLLRAVEASFTLGFLLPK